MKKYFLVSFSGESGAGKTTLRNKFSVLVKHKLGCDSFSYSISSLLKFLFFRLTNVPCFAQADKAAAFSHPDFVGANTVRDGLVLYARKLKDSLGDKVFVNHISSLIIHDYFQVSNSPNPCFFLLDDIRYDWEYQHFTELFANLKLQIEPWLILLGEPSDTPIKGDEGVASFFSMETNNKIQLPKRTPSNLETLSQIFEPLLAN